MFILHFISLLFILSRCVTEEIDAPSPFEVQFQWEFINFTWTSEGEYQDAVASRSYVPENIPMAGIKIYKDRIYVAIPRIRSGIPVTLGYITINESSEINPLVTPYPKHEFNNFESCENLQSVQSMEIDKNGVMWVLDGVRVNGFTSCPPKLVLLDLNDDGKVLHIYNFTNEICLQSGGFLNDVVIDDEEFAYITDNGAIDPGLIIFSREENRAWKIRDPSMFPEIDAANFVVGGINSTGLTAIDGIALSSSNSSERFVFYCALTGLKLHKISTNILKNEQLCASGEWRRDVQFIGNKQAQSDGMVIDNNGNLYYGLLSLYGVGQWNIDEPFTSAEIIAQDNGTMIWTDSFGFDNDDESLHLLANNINKFFDPTYEIQLDGTVYIRILKLFTGTKNYMY